MNWGPADYFDMPNADRADAELQTLVDARKADLAKLVAERDNYRDALEECLDWFKDRYDADCDQDGYIPNEEMKMGMMVDELLHGRPF